MEPWQTLERLECDQLIRCHKSWQTTDQSSPPPPHLVTFSFATKWKQTIIRWKWLSAKAILTWSGFQQSASPTTLANTERKRSFRETKTRWWKGAPVLFAPVNYMSRPNDAFFLGLKNLTVASYVSSHRGQQQSVVLVIQPRGWGGQKRLHGERDKHPLIWVFF